MDEKLEVIVIPVSDVDHAKEFYVSLGWRLDADHAAGDNFRIVQLTPPGSECSIQFGTGITSAAPGSVQDLYLIVSDIESAPSSSPAVSRSARCSTRGRPATGSIATARTVAPAALRPSMPATARSSHSATPTATAGCSRKSQPGFPGASTLA